MSELIDEGNEPGNAPEFSVSELTGAVKKTLEGAFGRVRVKGEVGRVVIARSGHLYFDLKDERSVVASVAWKGVASRLQTKPEEGMEVVASGRLSTFGPQSKYQLIVDDLAPAGLGALMVMLEKRRKAFEAEGLFLPERKKELPYLPEVIGVVTSPSGAVIRDILHRLRNRFPRQVLLWPVTVQGAKSAGEVAEAIAGFDALDRAGPVPRPDLLIVARGGGSIEDLWGFNEEVVVRAAARCSIPLISAVGHETDWTLLDHVADMRAPTPTAAAEVAVPVRSELLAALAALEERRVRGGTRGLSLRRERLRDLGRLLPRPNAILSERTQRFDEYSGRLPRALESVANRARAKMERQSGRFGPSLLRGFLARQRDALNRERAALPRLLATQTRLLRARLGTNLERLNATGIARQSKNRRHELATLSDRLSNLGRANMRAFRERLDGLERVRASFDHRAVLGRGFALVRNVENAVLPDLKSAQREETLRIEFRDGHLDVSSQVSSTKSPGSLRPRAAGKKSDDGQGTLF